ncbi:MAG: FtsX-like permease family protein [Clostridiaceae bacterium]|jgi:putative ABC transport system permease protein|nr:FtsX-like permease family protein [Clostridiaceae bacterium]
MKYLDTLFLSIKNLWRRKLRTSLTIVGVMIGTCAIVVMISLGLAMNKNFLEQISQMGNIMQIQVYNWNEGGMTPDGNKIEPLTDAKIAELARMKGVEGATPIMDLGLKMVVGKYVGWVNILGIDPNVFEMLDIPVSTGRGLTIEDTNHAVIGDHVKYNLYNPRSSRWDPAPDDLNLMEEKVTVSWDMNYGEKPYPGQPTPKKKVKPVTIEVVGMVSESGSQYDYSVVMPLDTVKKYKKEQDKFNQDGSGGGGVIVGSGSSRGSGENEGYYQAIVKVKDIDSVMEVMDQIKAMGYEAYSPIQILEQMKEQSAGLRQILGGIGITAFIIAAIGIANTMYMSIYERTREIGIIKVIGARLGDIRRIFLMEAGWIGVFGGVLGVGLSLLASMALNRFNINLGGQVMWMPQGEGMPSSYIPAWLMLAGAGFSFLASLLAGVLPARRAMKLSVMKALRQE